MFIFAVASCCESWCKTKKNLCADGRVSRMHSKIFFRLTAAVVVGLIVGYVLQGWMRHKAITFNDPPSPVDQSPPIAQQLTPDQMKGWCCPGKGKHCYDEKQDVICLRAGGYVFTYEKASCEKICAPAAP